jgi:hypothetical protein
MAHRFNPPPGWPTPPPGWTPPEGWTPDPSWPPAPAGWAFWVTEPDPVIPPPVTPTMPVAPPAPPVSPATPPQGTAGQGAVVAPAASPQPVAPSATTHPGGPEAALASLREEIARLEAERERVRAEAARELVELDDQRVLQQVGIYEYHHPLENAELCRERLASIQERIRDAVRQGRAVLASDMFSYNNSLALGRRMTTDLSKLMLRAYNAEADNAVRSLRAGNLATAVQRLEASATSIAKLGSMMEMRIAPEYHALRVEELELTADYLMKVQEEKERAREERERLREERKAEEELARERERLDKERAHYANALRALQEQGKVAEAAELEHRLADIDTAIAQNDYRAANIRAGYVYVISNVGAFGQRVVKIGMTRRLDPEDRIRELGDASVPFPFDTHAIYFSDDAVRLEGELHDAFAGSRLNHVNPRREFFFATPEQVREVLASKVGNLLEFVDEPEATQYHQSRGMWPDGPADPR